jgi:hypothetical protein
MATVAASAATSAPARIADCRNLGPIGSPNSAFLVLLPLYLSSQIVAKSWLM